MGGEAGWGARKSVLSLVGPGSAAKQVDSSSPHARCRCPSGLALHPSPSPPPSAGAFGVRACVSSCGYMMVCSGAGVSANGSEASYQGLRVTTFPSSLLTQEELGVVGYSPLLSFPCLPFLLVGAFFSWPVSKGISSLPSFHSNSFGSLSPGRVSPLSGLYHGDNFSRAFPGVGSKAECPRLCALRCVEEVGRG